MAEHMQTIDAVISIIIVIFVVAVLAPIVLVKLINMNSNSTISGDQNIGPLSTLLEVLLALIFVLVPVLGGFSYLKFRGRT